MEKNATVSGDSRREKQLRAAKTRRQQYTPQETAQRNSIGAAIARVDIAVALRIVELVFFGIDHNVIVGRFAEVNLRAFDFQFRRFTDRRDVAHD